MLLDTNIVSYFYRKDTRAALYESRLEGQTVYLSLMTVAELYKWPYERNWGERRTAEFKEYLRSYVVLPFDDALAWTWAELVGKTCRNRPISLADSWIAATALHYRLPIVTHNKRHFENIPGLTLISEE